MKYTFIKFKKQLAFLLMISGIMVFSQNNGPALEMAAGASNPTGNGPILTTAINFQNNSNNPSGNTLATHSPTLTATYTISNSQLPSSVNNSVINIGHNAGGTAPIFDLMNSQGSPANANFTSAGASAGGGIDVGFNRAVRMFIMTYPLRVAGRAPGGTHQMADITVTFNRPVNNPVLHLGALGGTSATLGFAGRFELIASTGTLSATPLTRLSGNEAAGFTVLGNAIFNNATTIAGSGAGSGSGSVMINGTNLTSLTFRVYVRGDGRAGSTSSSWAGSNTDTTVGEAFTMGFSALESDVQLTKTISNPMAAVGANVNFEITATNNGPSNNSNINITDVLPSGYTLSGTPVATAGTYTTGTGVWNIPNLNNGTSATLTIGATVQASGIYTNTATVTSATVADYNSANNTGTASRFPDSDGDGVFDHLDLDDDNDGILDVVECGSSDRITNGTFPTSGGNTNTVSGWVVGGTYGGVWNSSVGRVNLNANGLEFRRDAGTVTTLSQSLTGVTGGSSININDIYWVKTYVSNTATQFTFTVSYGGVVYATINSTTGNTPIITAGNGAVINISTLPTIAATPTQNNPITSSKTYMSITLPLGVPATGSLLFTFNAGTDGGEVRDLGMRSVSLITACADTDGDTIPNSLDLDSDGDGCFDVLEGGANFQNGATYITGNRLNTTVNTSGVPAVPTGTTPPITGYTQAAGQTVGSAQNATVQDAQCLTPFACNSNMYLVQNANTALYNVVSSTNPFTYPIIGTQAGYQYNATGLNPIDGFIYAMRTFSNDLLRIDANGVINNLGAISGLPAVTGTTNYNSGEIDNLGNYYIKPVGSNNILYRVNLTTMTATLITLTQAVDPSDLAYNTANSLLYGVAENGRLFSINPTGGVVTFIGTSPGAATFGALFGSSTGEIFGINNAGGFFQFNLTNGNRTQISAAPASGNNDGAHCVTAPITFTADLYVFKSNNRLTYQPGTTTTYTIVAGNEGPFGVLGATVTDLIPAGIPAGNVTYSAVVSGGATTSVVGTQSGTINDLVSLPVGATVTYTVNVIIPTGFTGNLTNTVTITLPTNITDSNIDNNTSTDTDTLAVDSDGDGIVDELDLDDDNDGILDTIECPPVYLVRPVTTSSITANKPITSGTAQQIADGEGGGGTGPGVFPYWYTNVSNLPITFTMDMHAVSIMDHIKLYGPWGEREQIKDFKVELYNSSNQIIGVESFTTPDLYEGTLLFRFAREYTNVTRVRFTILTSQGFSTATPPRASLNEIVFLDLQPLNCDTDGDGIPNHLDLDSDNDGCLDAIEGDENVTSAMLVNAASGLSVGIGSTADNQNLCATGNCVNSNGVPNQVNAGGAADIGSDQGQGIGDSQNALVNLCFCTQLPTLGTPDGFTMVGVSTHETQIAGWPENVGNGFIALDSQTKGMVITRVAHVGGTTGVPLATDSVVNPFAGMLVYDIQDACVKLFNGIVWNCIQRTCNTPTN